MRLKSIEIELNSNCNRSCSYCPNSISERIEKGVMKWEMFESIILQLRDSSYSGRISYSFYNEPLLIKNLEKYNYYLKQNLPKTNLVIYTNGSLLNPERFQSLLNSGVDHFIVTRHEEDLNSKFAFDSVLEDTPTELFKKHVTYKNHFELKKTNRGGMLDKIIKHQNTESLPCLIPMNMMTITNQGTILPCFEDFLQKNEMGNLANNNLSTIWNSLKYNEFRKKLLLGHRVDYDVCKNCNRTEMIGIH